MNNGFYVVVAVDGDERQICQWNFPDFDSAFEKYEAKIKSIKESKGAVELAQAEDSLVAEDLYLAGPFEWGENVNSVLVYGPAKILRQKSFR